LFDGLFSSTTWVSWQLKGKLITLDFNEAQDDGMAVTSAGPYANHLHFMLDNPALHCKIFYEFDAL